MKNNNNSTSGRMFVILTSLAALLIAPPILAAEIPAGESEIARAEDIRSSGHSGNRMWRVRCNKGAKLSHALRRARPGDTISIFGVCVESVSITTDNLTLLGHDGAAVDGSAAPSEAVILIDGALGVKIENLIVQNGDDQGILATHQAQGQLKNVAARNNGTVGLSIDRSHFDVEDLLLDGNGSSGMDAFTSSTVVAKGEVVATNNGGDGLAVNGMTFLELRGATVDASNNAGTGVSVINDSRLQIFSFPEAQGSSVTADGNGFAGIGLLGSELGVVGSQFFGSGANELRSTNNVIGFFMPAGAILSPHATARFVAENNGVGMVMEDGASALIIGGLNIRQNGAGIAASGAGTITLVSVPPNPSAVVENAADMDLSFGTRATINGVEVNSLICDDTVLVRGSVSCPDSVP